MKKKYEITAIENIKVTLDLSFFDKEEEIYFNATEIAHSFGKEAKLWLKNKETCEYLEAVLKEYPSLKGQDSTLLEFGKLVRSSKGRYGGTYLHNILAIHFARWCSPQLAVKLDKYLTEKIKDEHLRKEKRLEAKTGYRPMTDAIQQAHETPKGYHYSNECNMLTKIIKGKNAKQLRLEYNIEDVRSLFNVNEMEALAELQGINTALLKIGMEYEARKEALSKHHRSKYQTILIA